MEDTPRYRSRLNLRYVEASDSPTSRSPDAVADRREETHDSEVVNDVAAIATRGGVAHTLVGGHDFFAASAQPRRLAARGLSWDHPNMPWDGTELYVASLDRDLGWASDRPDHGGSRSPSLGGPTTAACTTSRTGPVGGTSYHDGEPAALAPRAAEFAEPDWTLGQSSYVFLDGTIVASWHSPA